MAWNYGQRCQAEGLNLFAILPDESELETLPLEPPELDALGRLGPEGFRHWAVRGWASPPREETTEDARA